MRGDDVSFNFVAGRTCYRYGKFGLSSVLSNDSKLLQTIYWGRCVSTQNYVNIKEAGDLQGVSSDVCQQ